MAGQDRQTERLPQPHGCMSWSLAQAVCSVGFPSYEIGVAAAAKNLAHKTDGEGTEHFAWNEEGLNALSVRTLETLLLRLRAAAKENPNETPE